MLRITRDMSKLTPRQRFLVQEAYGDSRRCGRSILQSLRDRRSLIDIFLELS